MAESSEPVAIIGISARVPGAAGTGQFWRNLEQGRETVSFLTDEELLAAGAPAHELADPAYVRAVPLIAGVEDFDYDLFGMSRREAEICDPQIRIFLEMTHAALENAGYDPYRIEGACGVFGTVGPIAYYHQHLARRPDVVTDAAGLALMTSNNLDYLATLASYKLNLTGPSFTVLSACSSSLVALHLACQSVRSGESDLAVAGGAMVLFPYGQGYRWKPGSVLSRDGHCRALDADASGTIFGSGATAVVVKRLCDALADGDHIRAVIPGIALNNDGAVKSSFSAPSVTGQAAVIMETMSLAGLAPQDISYVELHATGTLLGDPVELASLTRAYQLLAEKPLEPASCVVGSVKSNVGHLVAVAGLASLIKVVLSLEHEVLPPSINVSEPNPKLMLDSTPFAIDVLPRPWPRVPGRPRRAGVSSFGIGGTNAHLVVEEAPLVARPRADGRPRIVVWSARSREAEREHRLALAQHFSGLPEDGFAEATATLQQGRTPHAVRAAMVGATPAEAGQALAGIGPGDAILLGEAADTGAVDDPVVVFVFPASGSWDQGTARALYGTVAPFTVAVDELAEIFEQAGAPVLRDWLAGTADQARANLLVQIALSRTLHSWGLRPAELLGVGDGSLAAAVGGGLDPAVAVRRLAEQHEFAAAGADQPMPDGAAVVVLATEGELSQRAGERCVAALGPADAKDPHRELLRAVGRLWVRGYPVDWPALDPGRPVHRAVVPGYPYQRRRAWIDSLATPPAAVQVPAAEEQPSPLRTLGWAQAARPTTSPPPAGRTALVLLPPDAADLPVLDAVRAAGYSPTPVSWPTELNPDDPACLDEALRVGPAAPDMIVHAMSAAAPDASLPLDSGLGMSFWSLFLLAQRAPRVMTPMPRLVVVTAGSVDLSGSEPIEVARATLHGLVATLRRELPASRCRLVDLGPRTPAAELAAELDAADEPVLVALRGIRRWIREERPINLTPGPSALRQEGRYLLTGGLGGLGSALARGLAETGIRPRLVLLQRHEPGDADSALLSELANLGARVETVAADVADAAALHSTMTGLIERDGPFHGVFHLAGLPGGGLVRLRAVADADAVLRPKVHGTVALADALRDHGELDFVMLFSSLSGVRGVIGSGDYAAATAFQDTYAQSGGFRARQVLAVDWPVWAQVGMAARSSVDVHALIAGRVERVNQDAKAVSWYCRCSAEQDWFLDEHRLDGQPSAPGTGLLALILRAARELSVADGTVRLEDLTFRTPLLAPRAREVRVTFEPSGDHWTAELCFRDAEADEPWVSSATARITRAPLAEPGQRVDLTGICDTHPTLTRPPVRSRAGRLRFGPRWDVIEAMWLLSARERAALLKLPDAYSGDLADYPLHPALLDMATGMLCHHREELFLPFTYRQIVVRGGLPAEFYSHLRIRQDDERALIGDINLCDSGGRSLVEIHGFTMLVADGADRADRATRADEPPTAQVRGLDPRTGVRIALDLLAAPTPAQVLVTDAAAGSAQATGEPAAGGPAEPPAPEAPAEPMDLQAAAAGIWAAVFGVSTIDADADFFALGGDSLSAVELLGRVRDTFGVELDAAVVFDAPSLREFTELIERERTR